VYELYNLYSSLNITRLTAFWYIAPCSLVEVNCFGGVYCLHLHLHGTISRKAVIFILAIMRTRNLKYWDYRMKKDGQRM
jgi:hypothetical protein